MLVWPSSPVASPPSCGVLFVIARSAADHRILAVRRENDTVHE